MVLGPGTQKNHQLLSFTSLEYLLASKFFVQYSIKNIDFFNKENRCSVNTKNYGIKMTYLFVLYIRLNASCLTYVLSNSK